MIGSDERDENSSVSRGFVDGQRADVIIVGLIDENGDKKPSKVECREKLYENVKRGDDYTPAELVIGEPLEKNPSKYEDTKLIYREESEKAGIYKYGTGEKNVAQ